MTRVESPFSRYDANDQSLRLSTSYHFDYWLLIRLY